MEKPQMRVTFQNSRGLTLVADFTPADSDAVVILCHGYTSHRLRRNRFPVIAEALSTAGYNCLAFDFSGCGESDDDTVTIAGEVDDLHSAITYIESLGLTRIALYGNSLGSLICLLNYSEKIQTMVLVGAVTGPMQYDWSQYYSPQQLQELASTGKLTLYPDEGPRHQIIVAKDTLDYFAQINPRTLFGPVQCPLLIIHGDADWEERALLANSRRAIEHDWLPPHSHLQTVPGAPHGFDNHLERIIDLTRLWLRTRM
jgi:pimeloyl-ACP methyl ester carboxylesterase